MVYNIIVISVFLFHFLAVQLDGEATWETLQLKKDNQGILLVHTKAIKIKQIFEADISCKQAIEICFILVFSDLY